MARVLRPRSLTSSVSFAGVVLTATTCARASSPMVNRDAKRYRVRVSASRRRVTSILLTARYARSYQWARGAVRPRTHPKPLPARWPSGSRLWPRWDGPGLWVSAKPVLALCTHRPRLGCRLRWSRRRPCGEQSHLGETALSAWISGVPLPRAGSVTTVENHRPRASWHPRMCRSIAR